MEVLRAELARVALVRFFKAIYRMTELCIRPQINLKTLQVNSGR